ncbi:N-acetyltransferase [Clostridium sp. UBA4548]|uniref:N-acetyltransferase n=1 Tax=Clostridium sp. UBA4548 TaxID=1946361 RepID=UPI0025C41FF9|nr:N-acetyltransferase [Clostridium sp. UBA4548]
MIKKLAINDDEINKIMEIWKEATIKAHNFISEDYWLNSYNVVKEKYIPMAETYVYLEQGQIQGFISVIGGDFIGAVFVHVNCQGKGIGTKLIDYVKSIYSKINLAVYKENYKSVEFYKKAGFIVESETINEETKRPEYIMCFQK